MYVSLFTYNIQTFIDTHCACFDYDDENQPLAVSISEHEDIHKQYQHLSNSLLIGLSEDLRLDLNEMNKFVQKNTATTIDDSYEQLYSINDIDLFTEMMKRKRHLIILVPRREN